MKRLAFISIIFGLIIFYACNTTSTPEDLEASLCQDCPKGDTIWSTRSQTAIGKQSLYWQPSIEREAFPKLAATEEQALTEIFDSLKTLAQEQEQYLLIMQKDSFQFQGKTYAFSCLAPSTTDSSQLCIIASSTNPTDTVLIVDTVHTTYVLTKTTQEKADTISSLQDYADLQQSLVQNNFTAEYKQSLLQLSPTIFPHKEAISASIPLKTAQLHINNKPIEIIAVQHLQQQQFQERSYPIVPVVYNAVVDSDGDTICTVRRPSLASLEKYYTYKHYYLIYRFL